VRRRISLIGIQKPTKKERIVIYSNFVEFANKFSEEANRESEGERVIPSRVANRGKRRRRRRRAVEVEVEDKPIVCCAISSLLLPSSSSVCVERVYY